MLRIEEVRNIDGSGIAVIDFQASTVAELPSLNEELGVRMKVGAGSIAQVIQTGAWYTLDENGTWYDSDGAAANSTSNTSSFASPAVIDKGALLGQGKSILTADEPEQTEPDEPDTESEVTEDER